MKFHVVGRHRWIAGATITESTDEDGRTRRFTATIRGWRNWKIYQGSAINPQLIANVVQRIRDRIDEGDETIFSERNEYMTDWEQFCREPQLTREETTAYHEMEAACHADSTNELRNFIITATVIEAAAHDGTLIGMTDNWADLVQEVDANRRYKRAELAAWRQWQEQAR